MDFSSPLLMGLEPTVTIGGKAVAVVGSNGHEHPAPRRPPPVGLRSAPNLQAGNVVSGSPTVTAGGKPIATTDLAGDDVHAGARASRSRASAT